MKMPKFWNTINIFSIALYPLSLLYYAIYKFRILINITPYKSKIPVICIGNNIVGGAGKTPTALQLGKTLKKSKIPFAYLSKGYGGNITKFTQVNPKIHTAKQVGDEPLLLSEMSDTFICKNRVQALKALNSPKYNSKYKYIIVDDGLQNPTFYKNKSILVIDGKYGLGNNLILPAGSLREKLTDSLKKVQLVILMNKNNRQIEQAIKKYKIPLLKGTIKSILKPSLKKSKFIAFSGIGKPEKFFQTLKSAKIKTIQQNPYPDHYQYTNNEIQNLITQAQKSNSQLITTKKDWVRIDKKYQNKIKYLDIEIKFDKPQIINKFLLK